jgi:hypothetical protein
MDSNEFYKSLTEEQREYLEERLDVFVEVAHDFYDIWVQHGQECNLIEFVRTVKDAQMISSITCVITDSFINLLESDRCRFINDRYEFLSLMEERING